MIDTEQDQIGGYHSNPELRKWDPGSCWESEGRYLYKTVREMRPKVIAEVGTMHGCSTSHMALACKHNGFGKVYSIDNWQTIGDKTGSGIPADLRPFVELIRSDIFTFDWRKGFGLPIDLLLEDGQHTTNFTRNVLKMFMGLNELRPRRILMHDVRHWDCLNVLAEAREVIGEPDEIFYEPPADCGVGCWNLDNKHVK
jgi:hypothetical protein